MTSSIFSLYVSYIGVWSVVNPHLKHCTTKVTLIIFDLTLRTSSSPLHCDECLLLEFIRAFKELFLTI